MGATARNVDMTNVKESSGFNQSRVKAGDYLAIVSSVADAVAPDKTDAYVFAVKLKNKPSSVFRYYCKLDEKSLWKLRNILIAAGKTVPKKKSKVDPNQIVGRLIGVTIEDGEDYKDKETSEITGVFPASEIGDETLTSTSDDDDDDAPEDDDVDIDDMDNGSVDDDEEAEEEPEEEAEEDEAEEADPYEGLDRTALKQRIKALQADFKILTKHTDDDLKGFLAKLESAAPAAEEPKVKRTAKPKSTVKAAELSDDDLDDIDIDDI